MSREIKFRYDLLDINEMKKGEVECISASVSMNSLAQIKRTATFNIRENYRKGIDYLNDRLCPIMLEKVNGIWKEKALGVYLLPSPVESISNKNIYRNIQAYDTSQILKEDKFIDVMFYKKGSKYTDIITQIINSAMIRKVNIVDSESVLTRDREFEIGVSKLDAVNELLKEINYTSVYTDEMGYFVAKPYILPNLREIDLVYKNDKSSQIIADTMKRELNLFEVPNIWKATTNNVENTSLSSLFINDDPSSPTSTHERKRNIVKIVELNDIADQSTLDAYVNRLAYNATSQYEKVSFETLKNTNHSYSNVLYVEHEELEIKGKFIETSWSMDLKVDGTMKHEARRVITL